MKLDGGWETVILSHRTAHQNNGESSNIVSIYIAGSGDELTFIKNRLHAQC